MPTIKLEIGDNLKETIEDLLARCVAMGDYNLGKQVQNAFGLDFDSAVKTNLEIDKSWNVKITKEI